VQPLILANYAALPADSSVLQPLLAQLQQVQPMGWAVLLLPWVAGAVLAWGRERLLAGMGDWKATLGRIARLEWGYAAVSWAVERTAEALRGLGAVVEGEGYLGWLGLAALLGWLLWNL
jgi:hypothetical protein